MLFLLQSDVGIGTLRVSVQLACALPFSSIKMPTNSSRVGNGCLADVKAPPCLAKKPRAMDGTIVNFLPMTKCIIEHRYMSTGVFVRSEHSMVSFFFEIGA